MKDLRQQNLCLHCQNIIIYLPSKFCCNGCEFAYNLINKIGLGNYYKMRKSDPNTRKIKPENSEKISITEFVTQDKNQQNSILLAIDGLHCAACVWLIESILKNQPYVLQARINLSKKYLSLKWSGTPEYGDELVSLIENIGYKLFPFDEKILQEEEKKYNDELLKCLAVAGFGAGNVMLFSFILWFCDPVKIGVNTINLLHFFSALIALPIIVYAGRPFFKSAFIALKSRFMNMDLAISVAIFLACVVSLLESFRSATHVYFDSAIMLIFFLLIGRYLDFKARKKTFNLAREFSLLTTNYARLILEDGNTKIIASKDVTQGMILLVAIGDKIPADAILLDQKSEIDMSLINGESLPRKVFQGDPIFAGTINLQNPIKIKVTQSPQNSLLADIAKIIDEISMQKNIYTKIADRLARIYAPAVHILALATFLLQYFFYKIGAENALMNATAMLIITCPCALALATPIVQTITISTLIKRGILIKSGEAIEKINKIDTIIFDKTGTLTLGNASLMNIVNAQNNLDETQKEYYLQLAASMAQASKHPLSLALINANKKNIIPLQILENKGFGLSSNFQNQELKLGRKEFCDITSNFDLQNSTSNQDLQISCFLKFGDDEIMFVFCDQLKQDAKQVINILQQQNKRIALLSGDNEANVSKVASQLNIETYLANQTPLTKVEFIKALKQKNHNIMMVGDGLNDAPSLVFADVSVSFAKAIDISKTVADAIIQDNKLDSILTLNKVAEQSLKLIKQNLLASLIYNAIAIPFAVLGYVTPLIAAIAMSSSSIIVLLNSLRLRP